MEVLGDTEVPKRNLAVRTLRYLGDWALEGLDRMFHNSKPLSDMEQPVTVSDIQKPGVGF